MATATEMVTQGCSVASQTTGNDVLANDFVGQEKSSIMDSQKKVSSNWTNEKHSLYLKSMEASFIDQLYNSLDIRSCETQSTCSSDAISTQKNRPKACSPSCQFKVLQGGHWSKKSFKRSYSQLKDADRGRSHVSPVHPWIQRFTSGNRQGGAVVPSIQGRPSSPESQLHQEQGCINTEVTDQNFVEDTSCSRKRTRTSTIADSSNDQVVMYRLFLFALLLQLKSQMPMIPQKGEPRHQVLVVDIGNKEHKNERCSG